MKVVPLEQVEVTLDTSHAPPLPGARTTSYCRGDGRAAEGRLLPVAACP